MSYYNGPKTVTSGLVLCLDAGNPKSYPGSGTTWTDLSNNGNSGTLTNGPTYNSANGGSIVFDGVNDYATISNTNMGSIGGAAPVCTLSFWANLTKTASYQYVAGYRNDSNFSFYFLTLDTSGTGTVEARVQTATGIYDLNVNYASYYGVWTHISFVSNSTRSDLYINGKLVGSNTSITGSFGSTSSNFVIGVNPPNLTSWPVNGKISQVMFYNKALTASETLQNYNATKGRYGL